MGKGSRSGASLQEGQAARISALVSLARPDDIIPNGAEWAVVVGVA